MEYTTLGRTGLEVSVAGLGCGGGSRLGMGRGKSEANAVRVVAEAMDLGVNFIDTARSYGTEEAVGKAIAAVPRDQVVIATKVHAGSGGKPISAKDIVAKLERSLKALAMDYVDVYMFHGLKPASYDHAVAELVPVLEREREKGKLRFIGASETSPNDPGHEMLIRAAADNIFEVVMLGFNMMAQSAATDIFPLTQPAGIGTVIMFAVRDIFSKPERLAREIERLVADGSLAKEMATGEALGFLVHSGGADGTIDAAYRYARHTPGADVVLFGTGDIGHLRANIESLLKPPLPAADIDKLHALFGHLVGTGFAFPGR